MPASRENFQTGCRVDFTLLHPKSRRRKATFPERIQFPMSHFQEQRRGKRPSSLSAEGRALGQGRTAHGRDVRARRLASPWLSPWEAAHGVDCTQPTSCGTTHGQRGTTPEVAPASFLAPTPPPLGEGMWRDQGSCVWSWLKTKSSLFQRSLSPGSGGHPSWHLYGPTLVPDGAGHTATPLWTYVQKLCAAGTWSGLRPHPTVSLAAHGRCVY